MHQRARDRDALQLAAGELARHARRALGEADRREHLRDARVAVRAADAEQRQRQRDVLRDGQVGQHVERLEHEAHAGAAQHGQRIVVERREIDAVERDRAGVGAIETGDRG